MDTIQFENGNFVMSSDVRAQLNAELARVGASGDIDQHKMLAQTIIPPIKQIADYQEWTGMFFNRCEVGPLEVLRIAQDNPTMISLYTSPNGEVFFTRPGRTTYVSTSMSMIDAGLEIGWDDLESAGWDLLGAKVAEVGEEFARKRDAAGEVVLEAAVASLAGHIPTVATTMTKAAVDGVFELAATAGWTITQVAVNPATMMDMTGWTWGSRSASLAEHCQG